MRHGEDIAPSWPFTALNDLAIYINEQKVLIEDAFRLDAREPITGFPHTDGPDTGLTAYAFIVDSQLDTIETPNGKVTFFQAVGITADELTSMRRSSTREVLGEMAQHNSLLITDVARA